MGKSERKGKGREGRREIKKEGGREREGDERVRTNVHGHTGILILSIH